MLVTEQDTTFTSSAAQGSSSAVPGKASLFRQYVAIYTMKVDFS